MYLLSQNHYLLSLTFGSFYLLFRTLKLFSGDGWSLDTMMTSLHIANRRSVGFKTLALQDTKTGH